MAFSIPETAAIFNRKTAWRVVALAIFLISILRGIRFPNLWSYSHYLFNYEYGFVKRGLLGTLIAHLPPFFSTYAAFTLFSIAIFIINMILLGLLLMALIDRGSPALTGAVLVFASSMAVVFLAHTIGYFDHIGLLITLLTLRIKTFGWKMLFAAPAMIIALFIHEAILVIFFPIILLSLLFSVEDEKRRKQLLHLGTLLLALILLAFFISNSAISAENAQTMRYEFQEQIGYRLPRNAFEVLSRSSEDNLAVMKALWSDKERFLSMAESILVTAPSLLLIFYLIFSLATHSLKNRWLLAFTLLAPLSPLLLHIMGWDLNRWNALAISMSFLALYLLSDSGFPAASIRLSPIVYPLILFLIFLNGASRIDLFDEYYVKQFPFPEHVEYLIHLLSGNPLSPH